MDIIAEIGINHNGDINKARQMIRGAASVGCRVVKFQCHVVEDEYIPLARRIVPVNAKENIYDMMKRCSFTEEQEYWLKEYTELLGMRYLSTPFSREAADRLERMDVDAYKIGSGECNNYPLIKHIVSKGKPIILSTGMNTFREVDKAVEMIGSQLYALLHCVSEYPTPYDHVNLSRMLEMKERYHVRVGLSDHSIGIWTALAAVALGADVVEKHFTSDKSWPGSDIPISIGVPELRALISGADAIQKALGKPTGGHECLTADFAFASVVTIRDIHPGEPFTVDNTWVKRPGTGISAEHYDFVLGKKAKCFIPKDSQVETSEIC